MSSEVVMLGACVVDLVSYADRFPHPGETLIGTDFKKGFGGKGANQCVMCSNLGGASAMVAKIGDDAFGKEYLNHLKKDINTECVFVTDKSITSTANICVTSGGENSIVYIPGAADLLLPEDIHFVDKALFSSSQVKLLVCTMECLPATLIAALSAAKNNKIMTLVNAAPVVDMDLKEIRHITDFLCMNEYETSQFIQRVVDSVESAKEAAVYIHSTGFQTVIITLGENGVVYICEGDLQPTHVKAEKVMAVDTTGAGDAFVGSLAYYIVKHSYLSLDEIIKRCIKIAAVSVQAHGTQTSFPRRATLDNNLFL